MYDSLESAAKLVLSYSGNASADYIAYKYGEEAARAARASAPVAEDMMSAALNCTRLGARAIISKTASRTAKMYLKDQVAGLSPEDQAAGQRVPPHLPHLMSGLSTSAASGSNLAPAAAPALQYK